MWIAVALLILDLRWYKPEQHLADLTKWARRLGRSVPKVYHVLDAFGASQQVSSVWKTRGLAGIAYDIKLAGGHDICGETGVKEFLRMGDAVARLHYTLDGPYTSLHRFCSFCSLSLRFSVMFGAVCVASPLAFHLRLHDGGLVAAAPPCSLFVPACASVHKRSIARPRGDQRNFKVRLEDAFGQTLSLN